MSESSSKGLKKGLFKRKKKAKRFKKTKIKQRVGRTRSKFGQKLAGILILSMLIPVVVIGSVLYLRLSNYIDKDVRQNNAVVLNEVNAYIRSELNSVASVVSILTEVDYVKRMQPFIVKSMFESVQGSYDLVETINVIDKNGKIIYSSRGDTGTDSGDYIQQTFDDGVLRFSEISVNASGAKVINQAFPIFSDTGRPRGVMVCELSVSAIEEKLRGLTLPEGADVMLIDKSGRLIAHSSSEKYVELAEQSFETYVPFVEADFGTAASKDFAFGGDKVLASYEKIEGLGWTTSVQIPEDKAFKEVANSQLLFVVILLGAALVGFGVSRRIARSIVKPLTDISTSALVASGGDFTVQIDDRIISRSDEFGDLGRAFMSMVEAFRNIVLHIKNSTDVLDDTSDELVNASQVSAEAFKSIIDQSFHLSNTAKDDIDHAKRVLVNVNDMSEGSENVAQNTDQLNMLIKNNVDFSNKGVQKLDYTVGLIDDTVRAHERIEQNIKGLQKSAVDIGGITDSIMAIADQTNLLALNAAIEAARAGEAGRGFAVVANEIRNLADQSNKSASNITHIIKEIQKDIEDTSNVFTEASNLLENVADASQETVSQMNEVLADSQKAALAIDEISAVTEEHAATSAQINEMMASMLETLEDTSTTSTGMSALVNEQQEKNQTTVEKIANIKEISGEFKNITEAFKC